MPYLLVLLRTDGCLVLLSFRRIRFLPNLVYSTFLQRHTTNNDLPVLHNSTNILAPHFLRQRQSQYNRLCHLQIKNGYKRHLMQAIR